MSDEPVVPFLHPLGLNSFRHCLRAMCNGPSPRYWPKAFAATVFSALNAPFRVAERALFEPAVARHAIEHPPIFILGHWRTGTTLLHELMALNPTVGFMSTLQTLAPGSCIAAGPLLRPIVRATMPKKRPMDNMALGVDRPQEEEVAMGNLTADSYYLGWYFPHRFRDLFATSVLMEDLPDEEIASWKRTYFSVVQKASYLAGGRRLVLKNPVNTGRIPHLLALFPGAKFVYIGRDPFEVYASTVHFYEKTLKVLSLQDFSRAECAALALEVYPRLIARYRRDRALIPHGDLVEISYNDLSAAPVAVVERIHDALGIAGWDQARPEVEARVRASAGYTKNRFSLTEEERAQVQQRWIDALEGATDERRG